MIETRECKEMSLENTIRKVVVPVGGLGTRLLTAAKKQPKEMLPVFAANQNGVLCLKPMVEHIFEQLFDFGGTGLLFHSGKRKEGYSRSFHSGPWICAEA
jgi:UTP--glucose-1-phosphate uridylyltransferase